MVALLNTLRHPNERPTLPVDLSRSAEKQKTQNEVFIQWYLLRSDRSVEERVARSKGYQSIQPLKCLIRPDRSIL